MTTPAIKYCVPKTILGTAGAIQQGTRLRWTYADGEQQEDRFAGDGPSIYVVYQNYKALAGNTPQLDELEFDGGPRSMLVARFAENGSPVYELLANDVNKPIYQHTYFSTLTAAQVIAVRTAFEEGSTISGTGKDAELLQMLNLGYEEYVVTQYVLRETKRVSLRSAIAASFTDVGIVGAPPDYATANPIIAALPAQEWLKKSPIVRVVGQRRWEIQTEWWGADAWSKILYSGTGTP